VVQDDDHALVVLRYIEANPLRAGIVEDAAAYRWSSYAVHAEGRSHDLVPMLPAYEALSRDAVRLQARCRKWVHTPLTERELAALPGSLVSGRPYGAEAWVQATAAALGLPLSQRPRGRPRKGEK